MPARAASLHVLALDGPVGPRAVLRPRAPAGASASLVGTAVAFDETGMFHPDPTQVQVLHLFADVADAVAHVRAVADGEVPPVERLGAEVVEGWHAALVPVRFHGDVHVEGIDGPLLEVDDAAGDGPLVTMTTTGFHPEPDRALALGRALHEVQSATAVVPGRRRTVVSLGRRQDDGRTFTVWADEASMVAWAYRSEPHAPMIRRQRSDDLMPRSSFARCAVVASAGTWDGADPARSEDPS